MIQSSRDLFSSTPSQINRTKSDFNVVKVLEPTKDCEIKNTYQPIYFMDSVNLGKIRNRSQNFLNEAKYVFNKDVSSRSSKIITKSLFYQIYIERKEKKND